MYLCKINFSYNFLVMALPADVYRGLKRRWYAGRRRLSVARRAINRVYAMDVADDVRRELCGEMFHQVLLLCPFKKGKKSKIWVLYMICMWH